MQQDTDTVKKIAPFGSQRTVQLTRAATYASVAAAVFLIALKVGAWSLTESVAILASLVDSLLDGFASVVTLIAVRQAASPATRQYRYGKGKAEPLAALAQAAFIAGSAVLLTLQAVERLVNPEPVTATEIGIAVMIVSITVTLALVGFQTFVIRRSGSVAIEADSLHYKGDLLANIGVIAALILSGQFGWTYADPVLALAIAAYILWNARSVAQDALYMLMDRELPASEREQIKQIVLSYPDVSGLHDLRTRRAGPNRFIQMHMELNGQLSLNHAHAVAEAVELQIMETFPGSEVIVHQDPVTPAADTDRAVDVNQ